MRVRRAAALGGAAALMTTVGVVVLPRVDTAPATPPALVISLSAGVRSDSTLSDAGEKRLRAAIVAARFYSARIITTRSLNGDGASSDRAQRGLLAPAHLLDRWTILPATVLSTRDEALALRSMVPTRTRIAVVTSPLHTRRACATFEQVGFIVTCVASRQYQWWRVPYGVAYELTALVKYRWKGWI